MTSCLVIDGAPFRGGYRSRAKARATITAAASA
jgi:hypothetical protein